MRGWPCPVSRRTTGVVLHVVDRAKSKTATTRRRGARRRLLERRGLQPTARSASLLDQDGERGVEEATLRMARLRVRREAFVHQSPVRGEHARLYFWEGWEVGVRVSSMMG